MTSEQVNKWVAGGRFPGETCPPVLIETHISWVILGKCYVYKIKKPLLYSFLDFSSLEKRKYCCEKEVRLNQRLTEDLYLDVRSVRETADGYFIGGTETPRWPKRPDISIS
jgi:hypothetical protein